MAAAHRGGCICTVRCLNGRTQASALLDKVNKPTLLFPNEQMYIQTFYHNNELIPEQHPNQHNPMLELLHHKHHTSKPAEN
jgi:hypothetical protein